MRSKSLACILIWSSFSMTLVLAEDPIRKAELARIEKETQTQKQEAKAKEADLLPQLKDLQSKVKRKEKLLRQFAMKRSATAPTAKALGELGAELQEMEFRITSEQRPFLQRQDELEQERRRVMKKFPEPGDEAYLEVAGKLYTQEEWDLEKTRSPRGVAEAYIQELLRLGIIRSARYTDTTKHAQSMDTTRDGSPIRDFSNLNYTVQYVSKGGVLNERNAWVTVITLDGKHWMVSQRMKELEVLGGLP